MTKAKLKRNMSTPEFNSGIPVAVVPPDDRPMSIAEMLAHYVRNGVSQAAEEEGFGSFYDEDDFEEEDPDTLPLTNAELEMMDDDEVAAVAAGMGVVVETDEEFLGHQPPEGEPLEPSEDSNVEGSQ